MLRQELPDRLLARGTRGGWGARASRRRRRRRRRRRAAEVRLDGHLERPKGDLGAQQVGAALRAAGVEVARGREAQTGQRAAGGGQGAADAAEELAQGAQGGAPVRVRARGGGGGGDLALRLRRRRRPEHPQDAGEQAGGGLDEAHLAPVPAHAGVQEQRAPPRGDVGGGRAEPREVRQEQLPGEADQVAPDGGGGGGAQPPVQRPAYRWLVPEEPAERAGEVHGRAGAGGAEGLRAPRALRAGRAGERGRGQGARGGGGARRRAGRGPRALEEQVQHPLQGGQAAALLAGERGLAQGEDEAVLEPLARGARPRVRQGQQRQERPRGHGAGEGGERLHELPERGGVARQPVRLLPGEAAEEVGPVRRAVGGPGRALLAEPEDVGPRGPRPREERDQQAHPEEAAPQSGKGGVRERAQGALLLRPGVLRRRPPAEEEAPQGGGGQPRGGGRRLHEGGGEVGGGAGDLLPAGAEPGPRLVEGPLHLPRLVPGPEAGDARQPQGALQPLALRVRPPDEAL